MDDAQVLAAAASRYEAFRVLLPKVLDDLKASIDARDVKLSFEIRADLAAAAADARRGLWSGASRKSDRKTAREVLIRLQPLRQPAPLTKVTPWSSPCYSWTTRSLRSTIRASSAMTSAVGDLTAAVRAISASCPSKMSTSAARAG